MGEAQYILTCLYESGITDSQVATKYGKSREAVYRTRNNHPRYPGTSWLPQLRKTAIELGIPGYEKTDVPPVNKTMPTTQVQTNKPVSPTSHYTPVSKSTPTPKQHTIPTHKGNGASQSSTLMGPCVWCFSEESKPIKPIYLEGSTSPMYLCYTHEQEARRKQVSAFTHVTATTPPSNPVRHVTKTQGITIKKTSPYKLGTLSSLVSALLDD